MQYGNFFHSFFNRRHANIDVFSGKFLTDAIRIAAADKPKTGSTITTLGGASVVCVFVYCYNVFNRHTNVSEGPQHALLVAQSERQQQQQTTTMPIVIIIIIIVLIKRK